MKLSGYLRRVSSFAIAVQPWFALIFWQWDWFRSWSLYCYPWGLSRSKLFGQHFKCGFGVESGCTDPDVVFLACHMGRVRSVILFIWVSFDARILDFWLALIVSHWTSIRWVYCSKGLVYTDNFIVPGVHGGFERVSNSDKYPFLQSSDLFAPRVDVIATKPWYALQLDPEKLLYLICDFVFSTWAIATNQSSKAFGVTLGGEFSSAINDCGLWYVASFVLVLTCTNDSCFSGSAV